MKSKRGRERAPAPDPILPAEVGGGGGYRFAWYVAEATPGPNGRLGGVVRQARLCALRLGAAYHNPIVAHLSGRWLMAGDRLRVNATLETGSGTVRLYLDQAACAAVVDGARAELRFDGGRPAALVTARPGWRPPAEPVPLRAGVGEGGKAGECGGVWELRVAGVRVHCPLAWAGGPGKDAHWFNDTAPVEMEWRPELSGVAMAALATTLGPQILEALRVGGAESARRPGKGRAGGRSPG